MCRLYLVLTTQLLFGNTFANDVILNNLRTTQDDRHFADDIFKYFFFNKNVYISSKNFRLFPMMHFTVIPCGIRYWLGVH